MSTSKDEWMQRYKAQILEVCPDLPPVFLEECASAVDFDSLDEAQLADPEGEADSEMEYWTDDGDDGVLI